MTDDQPDPCRAAAKEISDDNKDYRHIGDEAAIAEKVDRHAEIIRQHIEPLRQKAEELANAVDAWDSDVEKVIGRPVNHPMATSDIRKELARYHQPEQQDSA